MNARVVAVIQARMGSSRLPGKVLLPLGKETVLSWVIRAARAATQVDAVVVATTTEPEDDAIVEACRRLRVDVVRGSESDVLSRFVLAGTLTSAEAIVRLNSDCPLLDPVLIDQIVSVWRADPSLGYVSTSLHRTLPLGVDVELATLAALETAEKEAIGHDRVHVTSSLYHESSACLRAGLMVAPSNADLRVTLDVEQDYLLLKGVVDALGDGPHSWQSVVRVLRRHPELRNLNAHVKQKKLEDG